MGYSDESAPNVNLNIKYVPKPLDNFTDTPDVKVDSDYNLFFTTAPYVNAPHFVVNSVLYQSLSAYQQASNHDTHSIYADPKFLAPLPSILSDFALQAGSPAIDRGQAVNVNKDFAGVSIPQGAGADIGAYEFVAPPTRPAAPLSLQVVQH